MTQNLIKNAWLDVADELEAIGLKLKLHLEQEASADDDVDGLLRQFAEKIEVAIDAVENAVEDKAVQSDVRETGSKLVDAVSTTFREATRAVRRQMHL